MSRSVAYCIPLVMAVFCIGFPASVFGDDSLDEGVRQYKLENYEEAVQLLKKARTNDPESTVAAFFLGMAYKQALDYASAEIHLTDAAELTPAIRDALPELIYVLYKQKKHDESRKWIEIAEKENAAPAKIAFLNGLVSREFGEYGHAVRSFEEAKALDPSYSQSADYEIALCYLQERKLKTAKDHFNAAILRDPDSDLADAARRYQDAIDKRMESERPLRLSVGVFGQYDSNVVLKPTESELASDITDEDSIGLLATGRIGYVPSFEGPFLFNAQYAVSGNFHQNHATTHDVVTNTLHASPGCQFGKFSLSLPVWYTHSMKRGPGYAKYMEEWRTGPLFRALFPGNHVADVYAGHRHKNYVAEPDISADDRDSDVFDASLSWIWLFKRNAFLNAKYKYSRENAQGDNWENDAHEFSSSAAIGLVDNLKLQLGARVCLQDYDNVHSSLDKKREDEIYEGALGLSWEFWKNATMILQYSKTRSDSNMGIYDYDRDLYSAGVEYGF